MLLESGLPKKIRRNYHASNAISLHDQSLTLNCSYLHLFKGYRRFLVLSETVPNAIVSGDDISHVLS